MVDEPSRVSTWALRVMVYCGAVTGLALSAAAIVVEDAPLWWVLVGAPLAICCGLLVFVWLRFRLRHRSPEARKRAVEAMAARRGTVGRPLERSRIAQRATRHKNAVLAAGVPTTAVVQFLAPHTGPVSFATWSTWAGGRWTGRCPIRPDGLFGVGQAARVKSRRWRC
ncbi:hypothetical protein ACFHWS_27030, partial [Micromonospora sp. LOL_013]|uniref:hypothetical protein n=1 Tax=Micromonospora sp. LOL_013 TaxID=3345414 RepID=UPI003A85A941